jgi:AcrR family transcriptional regulator
MPEHLNSVKTRYHHGALRPALIAAAQTVIAERGIEGFSLRETARRAGVSPSAPAHHFGDARGLLTAIAAGAFEDLADALDAAAAAGSKSERIRGQGIAYVDFALANRARFDLMWRAALLDREDEAYAAAARRAFAALASAVGAGAGAPSDAAAAPAIAGWAVVHGFARLAIDGAFGTEKGAAERAAEAMLPAVLDHLTL